ncbi:hypothetical protein FIV42_07870 [Persicimonas caeni]|uniref:Cytochrome C n=1 Tax=Persicimonas caeni TaxID=2292766 RepID=A0A4Y6PQN8_PERCE|nr:hypothetical protein [Persicimonas caeni]QDG50651.1 hypothetical protein FIV42_07870 [Persicimonas caeni]QED31872.1 hypothetical protein FRD00_07865 [Persicimonas caeni]
MRATTRLTQRLFACAVALAFLAPACSSSPGDDGEGLDEGVTYHKDIKPVLDKRCGECHVPGGAGPYALEACLRPQVEGGYCNSYLTDCNVQF